MSATAATAAGRQAAEALMVDRCIITAGGVVPVYDPDTDSYTVPAGAVRHDGPCRVRPRDNADRAVEAGGQSVSLWPFVVSVPMSVTDVDVDDVVTVTASELDPAMVGMVLRVRQVMLGSHLTARRLGCEVQT